METRQQTSTTNLDFDSVDIKEWFFRTIRLWPWLIVFIGISFFIAWLYLVNTEHIYQSDATLMIKDDKKTGANTMDNNVLKALNISGSGKLLENEIEILKSVDLLREVILKEQLYITVKKEENFADVTVYDSDQPFSIQVKNPDTINNNIEWILNTESDAWGLQTKSGGKETILKFGVWYVSDGVYFRIWPKNQFEKTVPGNMNGKFRINLKNPKLIARQYKSNLDVKQVGKQSTVITLSVKDLHYERGNAFLRSLIKLYNQQGLNDKNLTTSNTIDFLEERLNLVERELRMVENDVEQFKKKNGVTDVSEQSRILMEMVSEIDNQKALQQTQVNVITALEKELIENKDNPRIVPSTLGVTDISAAELIEKHNQLLQQLQRMEFIAGAKSPAIADLNNQLNDIRRSLLENIRNLKKAYSIELGDIIYRDRKMNDKLVNIPVLEKQLLEISRDRNVKQQIYLFLLQKREESAIALASSVTDGRTVESPHATRQVQPRPSSTYLLALFLGIILAILPILFIDFFDNKVGSSKEISERTRVPLIGEMNFIKNLKNPIQIGTNSRNIISEQIRTIRTNISFTGKGANVKTILVTSHIPGEGKSFTSLNIAASYALLNKRVIILEFDLRKPRLIKNLGIMAPKGITNYLSGQEELNDLFIPIDGYGDHLKILSSGPIPPNPSELILGSKMKELIIKLSELFDYIIIDSPPFSIVTDALLLKQYSDITIVVLRQGYSNKDAFREINEKLMLKEDNDIYIVLNGINRNLRYSYYSAKYSNGYGYNYGYGYADSSTKGYFEKI